MTQYIDKDALVEYIKQQYIQHQVGNQNAGCLDRMDEDKVILSFIDTLEVKDPYKQIVQYDSIKAGIQAHAEIYSFNIESKLFNQLTEEQQKLWRKEIEQACISGGEAGVELARDARYKENLEVKDVDLDNEIESYWKQCDIAWCRDAYSMTHIRSMLSDIAKHFFELGLKTQKRE